VSFQVGDRFLELKGVINGLLLILFRFDAHFEHFVYDLFKIFNQVVVLCLDVLVSFVDDIDEDFSVVLQGTSQSFKIVVHKLRELVDTVIQCCEVGEDSLGEYIFEFF